MQPASPQPDSRAVADGGPSPVWFLVHVPKCAGSTVEGHVRKQLPPPQLLVPGRRKAPARYFSRPYYTVPAQQDLTQVRAVIGHFFGRSLMRHFPGRDIRECVMIRDPLGFLLSHYNYRMSRYTNKGANRFSFELWYKTRPLNPVTHFLLTRYLEVPQSSIWRLPPRDRLALLDEALASFAFVATYKSCNDFLARLSADMGIPADFETRNVTPTKTTTEETVSASLRQQILEENALDAVFFEKYRNRGWSPTQLGASPGSFSDDRWRAIRRDLSRPVHIVRARIRRDVGAKGKV